MSKEPRDQQIDHLLDELYELRVALGDITRKLARVESVVKCVFPNAIAPREATSKRDRSTAGDLPTMNRDQALAFFDQLRDLAAGNGTEAALRKLDELSIANLGFLARELGAAIGKKKQSRRVLANEVLGRVRQSIMLTQHTPASAG
jgi:hypothetical protein